MTYTKLIKYDWNSFRLYDFSAHEFSTLAHDLLHFIFFYDHAYLIILLVPGNIYRQTEA